MKIEKQIALQNRMVLELGINLVTCGGCGDVLLHEIDEDEIECPHCDFKSDPCDFPDFFYEGMEY